MLRPQGPSFPLPKRSKSLEHFKERHALHVTAVKSQLHPLSRLQRDGLPLALQLVLENVPFVNGSGSGSESEPTGSRIQLFGSVAALYASTLQRELAEYELGSDVSH